MALQAVNFRLTGRERNAPTVVLCDLVTRWLILVEVMLSVKPTDGLYITI